MRGGQKLTLVLVCVIFLSGLCWAQSFHYTSTYGLLCNDDCSLHSSEYYWCNTDEGWDYCSPAPQVTYRNEACQDYPCDTHGYSYFWCSTDPSWDYCGRVETNQSITINIRQKRQPNNGEPICTEKIDNNKEVRYYAEINKNIADGKQWREEIEGLISQWSNGCLSNGAKSCLRESKSFRIDQQGVFKRNNKQYYNLQIQINKPRKPKESTTVALVILEDNNQINDNHVQFAFKQSFDSRVKVTVEVAEITRPNNQNKKCNKRS